MSPTWRPPTLPAWRRALDGITPGAFVSGRPTPPVFARTERRRCGWPVSFQPGPVARSEPASFSRSAEPTAWRAPSESPDTVCPERSLGICGDDAGNTLGAHLDCPEQAGWRADYRPNAARARHPADTDAQRGRPPRFGGRGARRRDTGRAEQVRPVGASKTPDAGMSAVRPKRSGSADDPDPSVRGAGT